MTVRIMAGQPRIDDDEDGPCGNAVVPQVAEVIGRIIAEQIGVA